MNERWISKEDFQKAKKALENADIPMRHLQLAFPLAEMPLKAPTEVRGEFNGGGS